MRDIYAGQGIAHRELLFADSLGSEQQVSMLAIGKSPFRSPPPTSRYRFQKSTVGFFPDYDRILRRPSAGSDILDVPSNGLTRFLDKGQACSRMGWADGLIPAAIRPFYVAMTARMDPKKAADSVRLFMPRRRPLRRGDTQRHRYATMINGVETGKAPEQLRQTPRRKSR